MGKGRKLPQQLAQNVSKLHKLIGELLTCDDSPFKTYEIRQEVRVSDINPDYKSNREKFDWVILGLNVVIEVHGIQHYREVCFGGITKDKAKQNFLKRTQLDAQKQQAAEEACWSYVVVKYTEKNITIKELTEKIYQAINIKAEGQYEQKKPKAKIQNRGFQKQKGNYKWPKRKLTSRPFQKKNS